MKIQKQKRQKKCVIKRTLNFQYYENRLEVAQNENKTEHLEKKKIDVGSLKEDQKELKSIN